MIRRVHPAGIALLAVLAAARPCPAAEGMVPGRGAIGGQLGASRFIAEDDYSAGAQGRLAFAGHFRYVMSPRFRWQVSPGYTWSGYSSTEALPFRDGNFPGDTQKGEVLVQLLPVSAQLQYLMRGAKWNYHVGLGPGVYRVWIQNRRFLLADPVSLRFHRGFYPGVTGQVGVERFLAGLPSTSIELTVATHWVLASRDDQFPSGFNSALAATEVRLGGTYYFDLSRTRKKEETALPLPGR